MTAKRRATSGIGTMMFAVAITACGGAPQYASTPDELDSGINVADGRGPDAVTPVLTIGDGGPMAAAQAESIEEAVPLPAVNQTPVPP